MVVFILPRVIWCEVGLQEEKMGARLVSKRPIEPQLQILGWGARGCQSTMVVVERRICDGSRGHVDLIITQG